MEDTHVAQALIDKRATLIGRIRALEEQVRTSREDLTHLDATIKLLDPSVNFRELPVRRPYKRQPEFEYGELARLCREALRVATEPLSAETIAARIIQERGLDPSDAKYRVQLNRTVALSLRDLLRNRKVEKMGTGRGGRWRLVG